MPWFCSLKAVWNAIFHAFKTPGPKAEQAPFVRGKSVQPAWVLWEDLCVFGEAKQVADLMGAAGLVGVSEAPPVRLTTISVRGTWWWENADQCE